MYGGFINNGDAIPSRKPAAVPDDFLSSFVITTIVHHLLNPQCAERIRGALATSGQLLSRLPIEAAGTIATVATGDAIVAFFESITRQVAEKV